MIFEIGQSSGVFLVHCEEVWDGSHEEDGVEKALEKKTKEL